MNISRAKRTGSERPTNSEIRLECVRRRALEHPSDLDVDAIKSILKSQDNAQHPVSGPLIDKNSSYTFGSVIMVLSDTARVARRPGAAACRALSGLTICTDPIYPVKDHKTAFDCTAAHVSH